MSGLSISAVADRVVVRERGTRWQAESGQYLLEFGGDPSDGSLNVIERGSAYEAPISAQAWFDRGAALERADPMASMHAYQQAIVVEPAFVDAYINLGRLLHESGHHVEAEQIYREGARRCGGDALLLYNLGVLLDDMNRPVPAMHAYEQALSADPELADCHYNLALLFERIGRPKQAIQHMARYRALAGPRSR